LFLATILVLSLAGGNSPPAAQAAAPEHAAILPQDAQEARPPLLQTAKNLQRDKFSSMLIQ